MFKMKLNVLADVVHGTDRGGEDLFLDVQASLEPTPCRDELIRGYCERWLDNSTNVGTVEAGLRSAFEQAWNDYLATLVVVIDDESRDDATSLDDSELYVEDGCLKSQPTSYEFQYDWSLVKAQAKVEAVVLSPNWNTRLKDGHVSLSAKIFVVGNAE